MRKNRMLGRIVAELLCLTMFVGIIVGARIENVYAADYDWSTVTKVPITYAGQAVDSITVNGVTVNSIYRPYGKIDTDATYSCAAFVKRFYSQVYGVDVYNLNSTSSTPLDSSGRGSFVAVASPQIGDIMRDNEQTHWGIVKSIDSNGRVVIIQQNAWREGCAGVGMCVGGRNVTYFRHTSVDGNSKTAFYSTVFSEKVTDTDAKIYAKLTANYSVTNEGFYISTNADMSESVKVEEKVSGKITDLWYEMNKWYGVLDSNTTYYYQFFIVTGGVEQKSDVRSFTTNGESSYYSTVFSEKVTDTDAKIYAKLTASYSVTNEGFYISKNANMSEGVKIEEQVSGKVTDLWYEMHKWYGTLDRGTTYYYRIFIVINGVEHKSDVRSFHTTCSHNYNAGEVTMVPTCVNDGVRTYTCMWCGATYTETLNKTGNHSYNAGVVTKSPTCVADGVKTYTCTICGTTKDEVIEKTGIHSYKQVVQEATTTSDGWTAKVCTVCGDVKDKKYIHKYSTDWTYDSNKHWHKCTLDRCDGMVADEGQHIESDWIIDYNATSYQEGRKHKECTVCGYVITTEKISRLADENLFNIDGWHSVDGVRYWYENGERQGVRYNADGSIDTSYRGKEIYDPSSDAWYWLDCVQNGAVAKNKDVYQESAAGQWGAGTNENGEKVGKWVRYDDDGHMVKGWQTTYYGTYYFDPVYGTMAKGNVLIDGQSYYFNKDTGILERGTQTDDYGNSFLTDGWHKIYGVNYWYENGVRQGVRYNEDGSIDTSYRGKEIYDPSTDAWYWLDCVQDGAVARNKDVYQESVAGQWGAGTNENGEKIGKWVRYDADGHMVKGWQNTGTGTYYFDPVYGTMAKGEVVIDGQNYYFDVNTGVLQ